MILHLPPLANELRGNLVDRPAAADVARVTKLINAMIKYSELHEVGSVWMCYDVSQRRCIDAITGSGHYQ